MENTDLFLSMCMCLCATTPLHLESYSGHSKDVKSLPRPSVNVIMCEWICICAEMAAAAAPANITIIIFIIIIIKWLEMISTLGHDSAL